MTDGVPGVQKDRSISSSTIFAHLRQTRWPRHSRITSHLMLQSPPLNLGFTTSTRKSPRVRKPRHVLRVTRPEHRRQISHFHWYQRSSKRLSSQVLKPRRRIIRKRTPSSLQHHRGHQSILKWIATMLVRQSSASTPRLHQRQRSRFLCAHE